MTSVKRRGRPVHKGQASEAPTGPLLSNGDHEDPLGSNEPGSSKAPTGSEAPEAPARPLEAPPGPPQAPLLPIPQDPGANRYSQ